MPAEQSNERVKRWPEVTIFASGVVQDHTAFRALGTISPPEERYVPVSSPRVLSVEEARDLAAAYFEGTPAALGRVEPLIARLSDFAEEADRG